MQFSEARVAERAVSIGTSATYSINWDEPYVEESR